MLSLETRHLCAFHSFMHPIDHSIRSVAGSIRQMSSPVRLRFCIIRLQGPLFVFCIGGLAARLELHLLRPRFRRRKRLFNQVMLEKATFHFRDGIVPIGRVFFEERFVSKKASDPLPKDDTRPVSNYAPERYPCWCWGVRISSVLDLQKDYSALMSAP